MQDHAEGRTRSPFAGGSEVCQRGEGRGGNRLAARADRSGDA